MMLSFHPTRYPLGGTFFADVRKVEPAFAM